ncbi:MAG: D-alanyl-D-alanine carboxypeptidase [Eubacterium sp.]|nr:D-alanyl-D-alanine carboxypeptidase [Eubacterium sp.]
MLKKTLSVILSVLILIPTQSVFAQDCSASSAVVLDDETGEILYQKNMNEQRSIASTTKIMTALIACESGKTEETVEITFDMVNTFGTLLGLREGDKITLKDLVAGMLLPSGNDAANAVALYLGGSFAGFAAMMNKRAAELGMTNSLFVTPSGLDEGNHHSTAYDMALLTAAALKNECFAEICSKQKYDAFINGEAHTIYNHNKLLSMLDNCIGVKTGYTDKAGRCLVSAVQSESVKMICVTLNAPDDWNDHKSLYEYCEKMYSTEAVESSLYVLTVGGVKNSVKCSYSAQIKTLDKRKITVELYTMPFVYSPVKKGDIIGKAVIKYKEKEIASCNITAQEDVEYYVKQK